MAKLSDTQLIILSKAVQRDDGAAAVPERMGPAAARKVGDALVARKLMREIRGKPGMPIWRKDDEGRPMSLVILRAGRDAIGIDDEPAALVTKSEASQVASVERETAASKLDPQPRSGSKQAHVVQMLSKRNGATLDELVSATGWLPHTTRAALTGLRKRGFSIERTRPEDGAPSYYRIVVASQSAA